MSIVIKKEYIPELNKLLKECLVKNKMENASVVVDIDAGSCNNGEYKLNVYDIPCLGNQNQELIDSFTMPSQCFTNTLFYKITPEQWLHKKGYTTKGTAYHKKTPKKGASKAFYDLFKEIHNGNSLYFENLINEVKEMKKEK